MTVALTVVAAGLGVLWQAGALDSESGATTDRGGIEVTLLPADVSVPTAEVAGRSVGVREGNLAPDFEFSAFDGTRVRLSQFRGRPVLLNFWASWCGPCRIELPDMEQLQRRYQDQGLAVLAVNMGERFAPADRFLQKLDVELTAFGYDPAGAIARRYGVDDGLPVSFFIDARGVVVREVRGQLTKTLMETGIQETLSGTKVP